MKNYYKILQIDKDASPEIIKVAYKLLVKKNHPDLKEGDEKKEAEEKIKEINEAYDVLSNPTNKADYDLKLSNDNISKEQYQVIINENINLKKELAYFRNYYNRNESRNINYQKQHRNMYEKENNTEINNNFTQNNNTNQFRKFFYGLNDNTKTLIALLITLFILFIITYIPFIRDFILQILSPRIFSSDYYNNISLYILF